MATINDFKLLNKKALRYAEQLNPKKQWDSSMKKKFGFYFFIIEEVTGIKDIEDIEKCIIDTEFCSIMFDENNNDQGIDAIVINKENRTINMFNFKFRETFKRQSSIKLNDAYDSIKFLTFIATEETNGLTKKTKEYADAIIECFKSDTNDTWEFNLFMVSNENYGLPQDNENIRQLKNEYELNIYSITLDNIVDFMTKRPGDINASLFINSSAALTYEETEISSAKSYLVKMSLIDLIRITCSDPVLRDKYNIEEVKDLELVELELGTLYDNVRGYLGPTKFNKNIIKTLEDEPTKFFMYNNGITMTAKNVTVVPKNGKKRVLIKIDGFQIVNGGQTLRSIYEFKKRDFDEEKLAEACILVRIFKTDENSALTNCIAEYTNSQNAISAANLKALSSIQIEIEKYLDEENILYVRKAGDTGAETKKYITRISMEKMAQIIYAKSGYPDRATNQKKALFEKYYDEIFNERLDFVELIKYITEYNEICKRYDAGKYEGYDQKYFYILYLNTKSYDINKNIYFIEKQLKLYRANEDISDARKLIQKGFREFVFKNYNK